MVGSMGLSFCWKWKAKPWCLLVTRWEGTNGSLWFVCYQLQHLGHAQNWSREILSQSSDSWWVRTIFFMAILDTSIRCKI